MFCSRTAFVVVLLCLGVRAAAQTGPQLLLEPFDRDDQLDLDGDWMIGLPTETSTGQDFRLDANVIAGRVRLTPGQSDEGLAMAQPRVGFEVASYNFATVDPRVPGRMTDISAGLGMGIFKYKGWLGGVTAGVGYASAGSSDFIGATSADLDDSNGLYGFADLVVGRQYGDGEAIGFVLNYDGNRTLLPDWVLPGFQYRSTFGVDGDTLTLAVGFPFSSIEWHPVDRLRFNLVYSLPDSIRGGVSYEFLDAAPLGGRPVELYANVNYRRVAAHWDRLPAGDDRIFFRQALAEAGFRVRADPGRLNFTVAAGYAFDQAFQEGFDDRSLSTVASVGENTYFRVAFDWRL
jgi:hypothetical protein